VGSNIYENDRESLGDLIAKVKVCIHLGHFHQPKTKHSFGSDKRHLISHQKSK